MEKNDAAIVLPVVGQGSGRLEGALLVPGSCGAFASFSDQWEDPTQVHALAASSMATALHALTRLPEPLWMTILLPACGLISAKSFFQSLSANLPCDLHAIRQQVGNRLSIAINADSRCPEPSPVILKSFEQFHQIDTFWSRVSLGCLARIKAENSIRRVYVDPCITSGIDYDWQLQRQWQFLFNGFKALGVSIVPTGVGSPAELAWLRRNGCQLAAVEGTSRTLDHFLEEAVGLSR